MFTVQNSIFQLMIFFFLKGEYEVKSNHQNNFDYKIFCSNAKLLLSFVPYSLGESYEQN